MLNKYINKKQEQYSLKKKRIENYKLCQSKNGSLFVYIPVNIVLFVTLVVNDILLKSENSQYVAEWSLGFKSIMFIYFVYIIVTLFQAISAKNEKDSIKEQIFVNNNIVNSYEYKHIDCLYSDIKEKSLIGYKFNCKELKFVKKILKLYVQKITFNRSDLQTYLLAIDEFDNTLLKTNNDILKEKK